MNEVERVVQAGALAAGSVRAVRRGFRHEGEYQQAMRKVRREWMTPICQTIRMWEETAPPDTPFGTDWLPLPVLVAVFAEHGISDADAVGFTVLRMQEQGLVEERGYEGVMGIRLLGPGRERAGGTFRLALALAPWAEPRQLEGPQ